ncbi:MAG: hypothetical protein LKJ69_03290 [Lactobacillus sp.]|jgi:hypothetical protein|nr:hypothetical protein [Lactobacillus sp.]MCI2032405.1 hypothetical protein [Lactobacillus sp.]
MFKDTKAIVSKLVNTASEPITTFDTTLRDQPELIVPLAVLHTSLLVAGIAAGAAIIRGHQAVVIAKEQTKQIKAQAQLGGRGHHHGGCHHGHCHHEDDHGRPHGKFGHGPHRHGEHGPHSHGPHAHDQAPKHFAQPTE